MVPPIGRAGRRAPKFSSTVEQQLLFHKKKSFMEPGSSPLAAGLIPQGGPDQHYQRRVVLARWKNARQP